MTASDNFQGFRTVVVGYDGTPQADHALALAQRLLDRTHGRIVLVHVYPFYRGFAFTGTAPGAYAAVLQERARELVERGAPRIAPGIRHSLLTFSDSSVACGINDVAESEHADLIVIGSTHVGRVGRAAQRSVVQRLLHDAPCAVAVATGNSAQLARIGVAFDGSPESGRALDVAYGVARQSGAQVYVSRSSASVSYDHANAEERAAAELAGRRSVAEAVALAPQGVPADGALTEGPVLDDCPELDLIVCGSRAHGPLRRVLAGSTALALVSQARAPVLVVPRPTSARSAEAAGATTQLEEVR